jgi:hypothetical protein
MSDYMPRRDGDLDKWEENFKAKLAIHGEMVGLTHDEITDSDNAINAHQLSFGEMITIKETARSKVSANNAKKQGMRNVVRPMVQRIKNHPKYTDEIGKDLGIVGSDSSVDYSKSKPTLKLVKGASGITIDFNKSDFDGIKIFSRRGNETVFSFLSDDTNPPYHDTRTNLNSADAELREYYAVYIMNDDPIGLESEIYKITV